MRVLIAAGGTGGHVFPAIAVAESLAKSDAEVDILCVGVGREVEKKIYAKFGFRYQVLPFVPLTGKGLKGIFNLLFALPVGFFRSVLLFLREKPDVVIAFGGYPSFLPIITAKIFRIPAYLQEQNQQVGLANKFLSRFVNKVFAVPGALGFHKSAEVVELANPVRAEFSAISDWKEPEDCLNVLVLGGSQGAQSLNTAVMQLTEVFYQFGVRLVHQTGEQDFKRVSEAYAEFEQLEAVSFIDDMSAALEKAHLVISRAGAMSVAEITAAKRPAIYVPLPIAAGHQAGNVKNVCEKHAAFLVPQNEEFENVLPKVVLRSVSDLEMLKDMAKTLAEMGEDGNSADRIAEEVLG